MAGVGVAEAEGGPFFFFYYTLVDTRKYPFKKRKEPLLGTLRI